MADKTSTGEVSEDQAADALRQLTLQVDEPQEVKPEKPAEPPSEPPEEPQAAAGTEEAEGAGEAETPEDDDVASLKKRTEELEAKAKGAEERAASRVKALQQRNAQNEQILRDRYLRKATVADKALKVLKASRSEAGAAEGDVDRVIQEMEGTMHPASTSYVPPESRAASTEDQALVLNSFLNEQGMTVEESEEFGKWVKTEASTAMSPTEQLVARDSLDGFLRIAHSRWKEGLQEKDRQAKTNDAVGAVRSVQRTQKEAARAASASSAAPKKQPTIQKTEADLAKLPEDQRNEAVARLLRQSVEQYRH